MIFVLFARLVEDLNLGDGLSGSSRNCSEKVREDFPGGTVARNPPGNSGDMGLIPGPTCHNY